MSASLQGHGDLAQAEAYGRALQCVAGFFDSEAQARAAVEALGRRHGLHERHHVLLAPSQASWLSFQFRARAWTPSRNAESDSDLSDAPLVAGCCGVAAALTALFGLAVLGMPEFELAVALMLAAPVAGAAAGWTFASRTGGPTQRRRFNRHVRRQLADGHWAVLAHRVPAQHQAGAAALLRELGTGCCVVAEPWRVL